MSNDHDASKMRERPVEPAVIDVEAEVSGEEQKPEQQAVPGKGAKWRPPAVSPSGRRLLAVCATLVVAGLALWALSASGFRFTRDDGRMAALVQRIETLEATNGATRGEVAELASLAAEIKSALDQVSSQAPPGLGELKSRMDAIESALQSAQAAIEAVGREVPGGDADGGRLALLAGKIDELQQRFAAFEKAAPAASSEAQEAKGGELAAAFASLEVLLEGGQSFTAELEKIAGISPNLTGLEELRPHAATGASSAADLALRLQAIADREATALAPAAAGEEQGLWVGLRSRVSGLVKIRDLGKARWIDGMAVASRQLAQGDIQQAVATLQAIEGPPPEELRAWLAEAQARAAIDRVAGILAAAVRKETAGTP